MTRHAGLGGHSPGLAHPHPHPPDLSSLARLVQVIVYVEDVNDEAPVFTQQQYSRLELRETAGIGTSVIVVRATDRDTGEAGRRKPGSPFPRVTRPSSCLPLPWGLSSSGCLGSPTEWLPGGEGLMGQSWWHPHQIPSPRRMGVMGSCPDFWAERGEVTSLGSPDLSSQNLAAPG